MRILLATDGSLQARGAEVLAEWLCYKLSAKLVALYVRDSRLIRVLELMDFGALTVPVPAYREELEKALSKLSEREAMVLKLRKGLIDGREHTLEEVGAYFGVTRERIRQIENKALRKLKYHESRTRKLRDFLD